MYMEKTKTEKDETPKKSDLGILPYLVLAGVCILSLLSIIFGSFVTVPAGSIGIVFNSLQGGVQPGYLHEGLNFVMPIFSNVSIIDVRNQRYDVNVNASTKTMQSVLTTVTLNYQIDRDMAAEVYKKIGLDYQNKIIAPLIQDRIKSETGKLTMEDLITQRQAIRDLVRAELESKLPTYGITVEEVSMVNFEPSADYAKAIEAKMVAEQQLNKSGYDLERIKVEAQQKIEKAKAEAEALRLQKEQITPELLNLRMIQRWDGKLPSFVGSGQQLFPMVNADQFVNKSQ